MRKIVSVPTPGVWLITGSRKFDDYHQFKPIMNKLVHVVGDFPSKIIHGDCKGIDQLAEKWANEENIPSKSYVVQRDDYGKNAGFVRNSLMIRHAHVVVTFPTKYSRGTKDIIRKTVNFPEKMLFVYNILTYT